MSSGAEIVWQQVSIVVQFAVVIGPNFFAHTFHLHISPQCGLFISSATFLPPA